MMQLIIQTSNAALSSDASQLSQINAAIKQFPNAYAGYFQRALHFIKEQSYREALIDLKKCLELGQTDAELYNNLAICFFNTGDPETAIRYFETAIIKQPDNLDFNLNYIRTLTALKQYEAALQYTDKALKNFKGKGEVPLLNLKFSIQTELQKNLGEDELNLFLKNSPHHSQALFARANLYFEKNNLNACLLDLKKLHTQNFKEPAFFELYIHVLLEHNANEQALRIIDTFIELYPQQFKMWGKTKLMLSFNLTDAPHTSLLPEITAYLNLFPDDWDVHQLKLSIYESASDTAHLIEYLKFLKIKFPANASLALRLSHYYLNKSMMTKAESSLLEYNDAFPGNETILNALVLFYAKQDLTLNCLDFLGQLEGVRPLTLDEKILHVNLVYHLKQYEKVIGLIDIIAIPSGHAYEKSLYLLASESYYQLKNEDMAIHYYAKARSIDSSLPEYDYYYFDK